MAIFIKLSPNSGYLLIMDKLFKTCRYPLFRGLTVVSLQLQRFKSKVRTALGNGKQTFEKVVRLTTDNKLRFISHVKTRRGKLNKKLRALSRTNRCKNSDKNKRLFHLLLGYCFANALMSG